MKILDQQKVCDGLDVTVVTDQGDTAIWHWPDPPDDIEAACIAVQKARTADLSAVDDLTTKKMHLELEAADLRVRLTSIESEIAMTQAAIHAAPKSDSGGQEVDRG